MITRRAYFFTFILFSVLPSLCFSQSIVITQKTPMVFPDMILGSTSTNVILPSSASAATFYVTGPKNTYINCSVLPKNLKLTQYSTGKSSNKVQVGTFVVSGPSSFNANGEIADLRIGATIDVSSNAKEDSYSGSGTILITTF